MDERKVAAIYAELIAKDVSAHVEKKNGLSYLSWAWAWSELKKVYPAATYKVYEREAETGPVPYYTDGRTAWVRVGVTVEELEYIEMLPIMDYRNNSIPVDKITSMDVNKAIQRALTKAIARHGLGLYIYAGEDLPEDASAVAKAAGAGTTTATSPTTVAESQHAAKAAAPAADAQYTPPAKPIAEYTAAERAELLAKGTPRQRDAIEAQCENLMVSVDQINRLQAKVDNIGGRIDVVLARYGVDDPAKLRVRDYVKAMDILDKMDVTNAQQ